MSDYYALEARRFWSSIDRPCRVCGEPRYSHDSGDASHPCENARHRGVQCAECGRVFVLTAKYGEDATEWSYGHGCERKKKGASA